MKHFYRIGLVLIVYASALGLWAVFKSKPPERVGESLSSSSSPEAPFRIFSTDPFNDRLIANRVTTLTAMAKFRERMARAANEMLRTRRQAALQAHGGWSEILKANMPVYDALLEKAKSQPREQTPCTICDGLSYMPCVMCKNHDGKCLTCGGSGHDVRDEFCPSCFGKGKCYLCNGNGKMFCPFCDDGTIKARGTPPSNFPPLY